MAPGYFASLRRRKKSIISSTSPRSGSICGQCGAQVGAAAAPIEPDWDSLQYDDDTPVTEAEADELYGIATEEEIEEEFDLINSGDEGSAYYRKVLDIVRWRRANGQ